jgi:hypothetical protein
MGCHSSLIVKEDPDDNEDYSETSLEEETKPLRTGLGTSTEKPETGSRLSDVGAFLSVRHADWDALRHGGTSGLSSMTRRVGLSLGF